MIPPCFRTLRGAPVTYLNLYFSRLLSTFAVRSGKPLVSPITGFALSHRSPAKTTASSRFAGLRCGTAHCFRGYYTIYRRRRKMNFLLNCLYLKNEKMNFTLSSIMEFTNTNYLNSLWHILSQYKRSALLLIRPIMFSRHSRISSPVTGAGCDNFCPLNRGIPLILLPLME